MRSADHCSDAIKLNANSSASIAADDEWHTVGKEKQPFYFTLCRPSVDDDGRAPGRLATTEINRIPEQTHPVPSRDWSRPDAPRHTRFWAVFTTDIAEFNFRYTQDCGNVYSLTFIGAGVACRLLARTAKTPRRETVLKTGDFDANGEEVFRSPILRSARTAMRQLFSLGCGIERQVN